MSATTKKPLVFGTKITDTEQAAFTNPFIGDTLDMGYIPGYSERERANDALKGDLTPAQREKLLAAIGAAPGEQSARPMWVRAAGLDGHANANVLVSAAEYRRQGYRPATMEDMQKHGWELPPTAHVAADGTIRREDVALWIVDGARAKQLDHFRQDMLEDFHSIKPTTGAETGVEIEVTEQSRDRNFTV